MLKRVGCYQPENKKSYDQSELIKSIEIPISEASYPLVFPQKLEFNPPVHETWNIVHIGMTMPQAHQIYVCAINCMRGVVLTAAEMNALDLFSCVTIGERDIIDGTLEDATADGVADVLKKLPQLPPVVLVFTVCTHHFLSCDLDYIYKKLERLYPQVRFVRCFMDPLLQKEGPTPDQKLRQAMLEVLESDDGDTSADGSDKASANLTASASGRPATVAILGNNVALDEDNDIARLLAGAAKTAGSSDTAKADRFPGPITLSQAPLCMTYDEYKGLGAADIFISNVPNGKDAAARAATRLGKRHLHMAMSFSCEQIRADLDALARAVDIDPIDHERERALCEEAVSRAKRLIGDTPIFIDYVAHPTPLGLAEFLLDHGFNVKKVYLNAVSSEEEETLERLKKSRPELILAATVQPTGRVVEKYVNTCKGKLLAIGPQAAWYSGASHFVNIVEGGGLYGYSGIRHMAELMEDAFLKEKDARDIVPRKGLGCESCI